MDDTYIYFIQAGFTGPIKIGVSDNIPNRIAQMQTGNPAELMLITKIGPYSRLGAEYIEKRLHKFFKHKKIRGEWFEKTISLKNVNEILEPSDPLPCEILEW